MLALASLHAGRPGLGAVPALRKWNERPSQLVIIRGGLPGGHAYRADLFGRGRNNRWDKSGGPPLFEPSFKVNRDSTHDLTQRSGFVVAPGLKGINAWDPLKVHPHGLSTGEPRSLPGWNVD